MLWPKSPRFRMGIRFIACLTHDVDHPSIRRHGWDHTTLGFLYRAVFGSLIRSRPRTDVCARRIDELGRRPQSCRSCNWASPRISGGISATGTWKSSKACRPRSLSFLFRAGPENGLRARLPKFRAARYGAQDIADTIERLRAAGCEVALHGIDAWIDSSKGREELDEIRRLTGIRRNRRADALALL